MIHAEFGTNSDSTRVRIYINVDSSSSDSGLEEVIVNLSGRVMDIIKASNTLKLKEDTFPEIEWYSVPEIGRYSDGFKLAVEVERRPRNLKEQTLDEYKKLVKADLLDLHNIFKSLVQDAVQNFKNPYPRIHLRHD